MSEAMPQQSSGEQGGSKVESEVSIEDSRLREGHIEEPTAPVPEVVVPSFTAAGILEELKAKDRPKVPEGKGKQKRGKNWKLDDIAVHYDTWMEEMAKLDEEGEPEDSERRMELRNRIDKADALLEIEAKRRTQVAAETRLKTIISEKGAKIREKERIKLYRKEGQQGIDKEEELKKTFEERIKELDAKVQANEAPPNVEALLKDARVGLEAVDERIAKRREAIGMDEDWMTDFDADFTMLDAKREEAQEEVREAKEEHEQVRKQVIEEYGEVLLELDQRYGKASDPLKIDMNAPKVNESGAWKAAKNTALVGGTTVGSMGSIAFGFGKDLFKSWMAFIKNPGKMFGGWKLKDFFWRGDGKKK